MKELKTSSRRTFVAEQISDKRGHPYIRMRLQWRKASNATPVNFPPIFLYPASLRELIDALSKFMDAICSNDQAKISALPTKANYEKWMQTAEGSHFHFRAEGTIMEALVAAFRIPEKQDFKPRLMQFYIREIEEVLNFLGGLEKDLIAATPKKSAFPIKTSSAKPTTPLLSPATSTKPSRAPTSEIITRKKEPEFDPQEHENDYEDIGYEISIRFDCPQWRKWVRRKEELEYQLFLESDEEEDRTSQLEELITVLERMSEYAAVQEIRDEIIREGMIDEDDDERWDME